MQKYTHTLLVARDSRIFGGWKISRGDGSGGVFAKIKCSRRFQEHAYSYQIFSCLLHQTFAHTASQMTGKQSIDRVEWAEKPDFEH